MIIELIQLKIARIGTYREQLLAILYCLLEAPSTHTKKICAKQQKTSGRWKKAASNLLKSIFILNHNWNLIIYTLHE